MKKLTRPLLLLLSAIYLAAFMTGCSKSTAKPQDYWPTSGWKTSTPEDEGMDSEKINAMFKYITDNKLSIHSLLIIRNGRMVTEGYFYPYNKENRHILNSAAKSITSALLGAAIEDKYIKGVDQKVVDIFSDMKIENMDERKKNLSIKNLLTMTAGLDWTENGAYGARGDSNTEMWASKNQVQYVLDKPMKEEPGKSFYYTTGASHVLSAIIQKSAGKTSLEYAKEKIFTPLGISDISWRVDNQGIYSGGGGVFMKPEDLAKFGYLYLNKGKWDGRQIIPEKWVEESTKKQVDTPNGLAGRYGYGYQWWMNKFGGYSARGFSGQYLFVIPEYNMVVVFTSGLKTSDFFKPEDLVDQYIIPAIKSPNAIPANRASYNALKKTIEDIGSAPAPKAVPKLPDTALRISANTYIMDNKETYCFEFKEGSSECIMHWFSDGVMYDVKVGLDGVYRESSMDQFYWKGMVSKAAFRGGWTDNNTFLADLIPLEDSNTYTMEFKFDGSTLKSKMVYVLNGTTANSGTGTAMSADTKK